VHHDQVPVGETGIDLERSAEIAIDPQKREPIVRLERAHK